MESIVRRAQTNGTIFNKQTQTLCNADVIYIIGGSNRPGSVFSVGKRSEQSRVEDQRERYIWRQNF
jgi:hypothetical protein